MVALPELFLPHSDNASAFMLLSSLRVYLQPPEARPGVQGKASVSSFLPCLDVVHLRRDIIVGWKEFLLFDFTFQMFCRGWPSVPRWLSNISTALSSMKSKSSYGGDSLLIPP